MRHVMLKTALAASLTCVASITCVACTGTIDSDRTREQGFNGGPAFPGGGFGAPTNDGTPGAIANTDEEMRAEDPELFDVASQYFPGTTGGPGKTRLFRLTRAQLDITTKTVLPDAVTTSVAATMPRDPLQTNYELSEILNWNAANLTPYASWVSEVAARVRENPRLVIDCASETDSACIQQAAERFVTRAFRGISTPEQLGRFTAFFNASVAEIGLADATADLVDITLTSPSYVFRDEVSADAQGIMLPAQQLQHLTYALTDAPPEALQMTTPSAITPALIDLVLASPLARDKLMRFFIAWLEIREPAEFGLATNIFPEWTEEVAAVAVADTKAFLARELAGATPTLKTITQSTDAFASPQTAFLYGSTAAAAATPIAVDPTQRLGIFTQPAVVASHSGPTSTRLVKRGVFFTRKVMCLPLGAPPDGVNTMLPMTPGATERQRIESITSVQPCSGCHTFINPFGSMQEGIDAIGRFRTHDESNLPIDASISIAFLEDGPLMASTGVEALRGITSSSRFKQCFARQVFRYYMGREEQSSDDPVLRQMFFEFAKNDEQDILGMLRTLASSSTFTQRTEAP